jgi:hypothetical protein
MVRDDLDARRMVFLMKLITQCESHDQIVAALVGRRNESYGGTGKSTRRECSAVAVAVVTVGMMVLIMGLDVMVQVAVVVMGVVLLLPGGCHTVQAFPHHSLASPAAARYSRCHSCHCASTIATIITSRPAMVPRQSHCRAQGQDDDDDDTCTTTLRAVAVVHAERETTRAAENTRVSSRQQPLARAWLWGLWSAAASVAVTFTTTTTAVATDDALVRAITTTTTALLPCSTVILAATATATTTTATDTNLFRGQPLLTNPLLEQVRIWNQAQADNIRYGGELERGDAANKGQVSAYYPQLLVPILKMARDVDVLVASLSDSSSTSLPPTLPLPAASNNGVTKDERTISSPRLDDSEMVALLSQSVYETIEFKRIFNAFADNIYYSDPDRANLYLAGGGT